MFSDIIDSLELWDLPSPKHFLWMIARIQAIDEALEKSKLYYFGEIQNKIRRHNDM